MRKTAAALIMALLITAAAGTLLVRLGKANPYGEWAHIDIASPQNGIYQNTTIPLQIWVYIPQWSKGIASIVSIYYNVDSTSNVTLVGSLAGSPKYEEYAPASGKLVNLGEGVHTLRAYANLIDGRVLSTGCTFTVNTTFERPQITILSPLNLTYAAHELPLIYSVDGKVKYATFSLDNNHQETSFQGNTTLNGLTEGEHTIYLSILTEWNIYSQEKVNFAVAEPEPRSFPTVPVLATSAVSIAAVTAAGLIFTRRRRRKEAKHT